MNTDRWSFICNIGMVFLLVGLPYSIVQASCPIPAKTNTSIGANICTIAAVSGVDVVSDVNNIGVLTLDNAGSLITINNGGELRVGSVSITNGSISIQAGGTLKTNAPIFATDADNDFYAANITTLFNASGTGKNRLGSMTTLTLDANDDQSCADGANPGTCKMCTTGAIANVAAGSDTNSDCGVIDCHTGETKYYSGWDAFDTCYYKADVSAALATCDGAGACKTTAVECTASTQGVSTGTSRSLCHTSSGCSGTTGPTVTGHVASGSDTYSDCGAVDCDGGVTKYYSGWASNVCYYMLDVSAANAKCDGAGACKTTAVECAASTQGLTSGVTRTTCKTQVGCTGTTIGSLGNVANGADTYNDCAAPGVGTECATGNCGGSGSCANIDAGSEGNCAACKECGGGSGCVNKTNNTQDTVGSNLCNATCKKCSSGSCGNQITSEDLFNQCTAGNTAFVLTNAATSTSCTTQCGYYACNNGTCNGSGACDSNSTCTCTDVGYDAGGTNNGYWGWSEANGCWNPGAVTCSSAMNTYGGAPTCSGSVVNWTKCKCAL